MVVRAIAVRVLIYCIRALPVENTAHLPISPHIMRNNCDRVRGRLIHYRITAEFLAGT